MMANRGKLLDITAAFLKLGLTSFGGPIAHLGYLRTEFVQRRRWIDEKAYGDLVGLCQFLPGPTSSQVVFALGMQQGGLLGALLASFCFTLPSAVLMIFLGYGVGFMGDLAHAGWLHGLKLAAVAVVAQAVWGMGRNLCPDRPRLTIALVAAALLLVMPGALVQMGVLIGGALAGGWLYRGAVSISIETTIAKIQGHRLAIAALTVFLVLLVALPTFATLTGDTNIAVFDSFYRAGSLVFGGGHVILPLLRAEVVPPGWIGDDMFLAGYGAAQAVPGPLFTFAAYLGTVMQPGPSAWIKGVGCMVGIFLPACLLIGGTLPFWALLRTKAWVQAALRGANAAVVGILLAALYNPVWLEGVKNPRDLAAALVAFSLLELWKLPPWLVVLMLAAAGQWILH